MARRTVSEPADERFGGAMHEIEAVGWTAPYKSANWTQLSK